MSSLLKFNPCASEFVPSFGTWQEPQIAVSTATVSSLVAVEAAPSCPVSDKSNRDGEGSSACQKTLQESSIESQNDAAEKESGEPTAANQPRKASLTAAAEGSDKDTPPGLDYELWSEDEPPTLVWSRSFDERELRAMEEEVGQSDSSDSTVRFPSGGSGSDEPAAEPNGGDNNNSNLAAPADDYAAAAEGAPLRTSHHREIGRAHV